MSETLTTPTARTFDPQAGSETSRLTERIESLKSQVDTLKARVDEAKSWAQGRAGQAGAWATQRREKVKDLVTEEPVMAVTVSVGVALLIGVGAGLLLARAFDER